MTARGWFETIEDGLFNELYTFVRLAYPYAPTEATLVDAFERARARGPRREAPTTRAWLYKLARESARATDHSGEFQRHNGELIGLGLADAAAEVPDLTPDRQCADAVTVAAFAALAPDDQEVLRLRTLTNLYAAELAYVLGLDEPAAQAASDQATQHLTEQVDRLEREALDEQP